MRQIGLAGPLLLTVLGCAGVLPSPYAGSQQPAGAFYANPAFLATANYECVWEHVVDVVDDYFPIQREEPVRLVGNVITEGRLESFPAVGATIFEPWQKDSAGAYERLESTLQSIRRRAVVRVVPSERGFWVDLAVFKELEDVAAPYAGTAGSATFYHDGSLTRVVNPVFEQEINEGWTPLGRDTALEQRMLQELLARFTPAGTPVTREKNAPSLLRGL